MIDLRILVVDDNPTIRDGIKLSLENGNWQTTIDEANNGLEAFNLAIENDYDIVLMDLSMPIMDGTEAIKRILEIKPNKKILVVSMHSAKDVIEQTKKMGAKGYLLKDDLVEKIVEIINRILNEELVFDQMSIHDQY